MWAMFSSEPVSRLSRQITRCPLPSRCSQRWDPRKPAPPVTTQVVIAIDASGAGASGARRVVAAISVNLGRKIVQKGGETGFGRDLGCHVRCGDLKRLGGAER